MNTGKKIEVDSVVEGNRYDILHIHLHSMDEAEATEVFSDKTETARMIYEYRDKETIFDGYEILLSIEDDPLIFNPGELLIRMGKNKKTASGVTENGT